MKTHPQESVEEILKEQGRKKTSSMLQRVADSTLARKTTFATGNTVWSIRVPKVHNEGTELAEEVFEHLMFVSGTAEEARKAARVIVGCGETEGEEGKERPNWKVEKGFGKEYVIDAKKFVQNHS